MSSPRDLLCTAAGILGGIAAWAFGGWDSAMACLVTCMAADYISGCLVALIFHKSPKTATGAYLSTCGWRGLCRKCLMLLFVLAAVRMDALLGTDYLRSAVCIGFSSNELLSITDNLGLAGIPLPKKVISALEILR